MGKDLREGVVCTAQKWHSACVLERYGQVYPTRASTRTLLPHIVVPTYNGRLQQSSLHLSCASCIAFRVNCHRPSKGLRLWKRGGLRSCSLVWLLWRKAEDSSTSAKCWGTADFPMTETYEEEETLGRFFFAREDTSGVRLSNKSWSWSKGREKPVLEKNYSITLKRPVQVLSSVQSFSLIPWCSKIAVCRITAVRPAYRLLKLNLSLWLKT